MMDAKKEVIMEEAAGQNAASLSSEMNKPRKEELQLDLVQLVAKQFQVEVDKNVAIREELRKESRNLEKVTRAVIHILHRVQIDADDDDRVMSIGKEAEEMVKKEVAPVLLSSVKKMPEGEYFRYAEFVRPHIVRAIFGIEFAGFLQGGPLLTLERASEILGIPTREKNQSGSPVCLEWEEYLEGMLDVGQELSRLAKNCVVMNNHKLVAKIHKYVTALSYGFSGMNFKNDSLRKKFDSLKYNARAIEEVVYDLMMKKGEK